MSEAPAAGIPSWDEPDRLRKALRHAGLGVGEMAAYLGVERNTVGNYLSGRTKISGPARRLWAMRTGVPVEWLMSGVSGQPTPPAGEHTHHEGEAPPVGLEPTTLRSPARRLHVALERAA